MIEPEQSKKLTTKQEAFAAFYIGEANGNATEAARLAGYRGSDDTLGKVGFENTRHPKIADRIKAHREAIEAKGLATAENRIAEYNERWRLLRDVRAARAADSQIAALPGGKTGLIVGRLKKVEHVYAKDPDDPESQARRETVETWEHEVDTGYLREMRELEKQAAQDLGQWEEKTTATHDATAAFVGALREFGRAS